MVEFEKVKYKKIEIIDNEKFFKLLSKNGQPIAIMTGLSVTNETVNIGKMYIDPRFRNKKLAKKMHAELVTWAIETGHNKIEIELAPNKKDGNLDELVAVIEHFGYKCYNTEDKGKNTLLCYHLRV